MNLLNWTNRLWLQQRYFTTAQPAEVINTRLYTIADPAGRALALEALAAIEAKLAGLHSAAFGPDPIEHENGRDMAESLTASTELLDMLAATERVLAGYCTEMEFEAWLIGIPAAEAKLWWVLAAEADRAARADLIEQLADLAAERVGGQAAEELACQADVERHLAAGAKPLRGRFISSRAIVAVVYLALISAMLVDVGGWWTLTAPAAIAAIALGGRIRARRCAHRAIDGRRRYDRNW